MKVKDLIKFLKGCDQNAEVVSSIYVGVDTVAPLKEVQEVPKGQAIPESVTTPDYENAYVSSKRSAKRSTIFMDFC